MGGPWGVGVSSLFGIPGEKCKKITFLLARRMCYMKKYVQCIPFHWNSTGKKNRCFDP